MIVAWGADLGLLNKGRKEDYLLFPMADKILSPDDHELLLRQFESADCRDFVCSLFSTDNGHPVEGTPLLSR
jgi:hypothetical protein